MDWIFPTILVLFGAFLFSKTIRIVPNRTAFIIERLGKYHATLNAGFHILIPIIDKVAYKQNLKEVAIDVPPQTCVTRDNVSVEVDGILYVQVTDPHRASYGIQDYQFAVIQLSQTTMRSVVGKLDLDKTFEERESMNGVIVSAVDKASDPWGVKVTRYEVKNIHPPQSVRDAMEKQMRAEREKRAQIAESEGDKQSKINRSQGEKQQMIEISEGEKLKRINEAEGRAQEIERIASATAEGIRRIAEAINLPGGKEAVQLQVAQDYIKEFGKLAQTNNTMIVPSNVSDISTMIATATKIFDNTRD
jgi:regulator of protease activity HflC (stomatin/prohibitin superfamily)